MKSNARTRFPVDRGVKGEDPDSPGRGQSGS